MNERVTGITLASPHAEPAPAGRPSHRPVDETARRMTPGQRAAYRHLLRKLRASR